MYNNSEVVNIDYTKYTNIRMSRRFLPLLDNNVSVWISRDCDSRLCKREAQAVEEWFQTDKTCHILRDAWNHTNQILGGMFGINNELFRNRYKDIPNIYFSLVDGYGIDQDILRDNLWPIIKDDHVYHDYWYYTVPKNLNLICNKDILDIFNESRKLKYSYLYDNKGISKKFSYNDIDNISNTLYIGQIFKNSVPDSNEEYILRDVNYRTSNKISVIIPTYNRFQQLLNAIHSVKQQTYPIIEIIVVNDCSTDQTYYNYDFATLDIDIHIIHLEKNTKELLGYPCAGFVRNIGINKATGTYIAFLDDDDIWFPKKLELQINAMINSKCQMCCTDGLIGLGEYNPDNKYKIYNAEQCYLGIRNIYRNNKKDYLEYGFPDIWDYDFLKIHNCVICSSVLMHKDILARINNMNLYPNGQEDYDCWLRALQYTKCVYIKDICFYYDSVHSKS